MRSRRRALWLWAIWFLLLPLLTLSPWVAPYHTHLPFLLGLPYTLFWWIALTLLLLVSLWRFVLIHWREEGG